MATATLPQRRAVERPAALREALLLAVLLAAYDLIRLVASDDLAPAVRHARLLLGIESHLGLAVEAPLNGALAGHRRLEVASSYWYATLHYAVTPLVLVLLYRCRPAVYRRARTALVAATAVALTGYLVFPTAPPRLLAGYVDVLRRTADAGWWSGQGSAVRGAGRTVNTLAAMPSMHVGWALWCGLVLAALSTHRWQRMLAYGYPVATTLVVVATANHWVLDAVAGAALMGVSWAVLAAAPAGRTVRNRPADRQRSVGGPAARSTSARISRAAASSAGATSTRTPCS